MKVHIIPVARVIKFTESERKTLGFSAEYENGQSTEAEFLLST